mgnify:CR=1 FL=1
MTGEYFPTLASARELASARNWTDLSRFGSSVAPEEIEQAPELAYLIADARRRTGDLDGARQLGDSAYAGALRAADTRLTLRALNLAGMIDFESGAIAQAEEKFGELLERATELRDDEFAARAANNLGIIANVREERELALTSYQRAMATYERLGHLRGLAQTSYNLGISYRDMGFADAADKLYSRAMLHGTACASEDVVALAETERALLRAHSGDADLAERLARRALERLERLGDPLGAANAVRALGAAAMARGDKGGALELLDRALSTAREHGDPLLTAEIQLDRGAILLEMNSLSIGSAAIEEAVAAFEQLGSRGAANSARALLPRCERK